jgi:hypothetical protein
MSDAHLTDRAQRDDPPARRDSGTPGYGDGPGPEPIELSAEPIHLSRREPVAEEPARPWSRRRKIVLGVGLAVGLAGVSAFGAFGWRVTSQSDAAVQTPAQVAGLARDDSERARSTAEYLRSGFAADIELDRSFGVVYRDPADEKRSVLVFGGTTLLWQPERDLDRLFELMNDDTGTVEDLRDVPAGRLGGVMKCGTTTGEDDDFSVCGWADHGSVAMAMLPGRPVDGAADLFRQIRESVQSRS